MRKVRIEKGAASCDGEDPLLGAHVEIDLEIVRKKMGSAYANFTRVPPNIDLELEILRYQLH